MIQIAPTLRETIARARADLRLGLPVMISHQGATHLVAAVETLRADRFKALSQTFTLSLVLTDRRAQTLKIRAYDGSLARIEIAKDTPLSALQAIADPSQDLAAPLKGPFIGQRGGDTTSAKAALALAKSALVLPALLITPVDDGFSYAAEHNLTVIPSEETLVQLAQPLEFDRITHARVPLRAANAGSVHVFRDGFGGEEHFAVVIGQPDKSKPVLTRLHSACFTGDILGSLKCDCGPQLDHALKMIGEEGAGILLYLAQEGRNIGAANKMRAYRLQDQGFDTVEANHRLGFEDDERDFRIGASLLRELSVTNVRLLTNNPNKIARMEDQGIKVSERVPLTVGKTDENSAYLAVKARKSGHLL